MLKWSDGSSSSFYELHSNRREYRVQLQGLLVPVGSKQITSSILRNRNGQITFHASTCSPTVLLRKQNSSEGICQSIEKVKTTLLKLSCGSCSWSGSNARTTGIVIRVIDVVLTCYENPGKQRHSSGRVMEMDVKIFMNVRNILLNSIAGLLKGPNNFLL